MLTFERLAELGLTTEQVDQIRAMCEDDASHLRHLRPSHLIRAGVGALRAESLIEKLGEPAAVRQFVTMLGPQQMDAEGVLSLMEADADRIDELMPIFLSKARHGGVRLKDGSGADLALTREMEEKGPLYGVCTSWRGRLVFRLEGWLNKAPPWRDPFHPSEPLLPDGTNPLDGRNYCYGGDGVDLAERIPLLFWAASRGRLAQLDAWTVIDRFRVAHVWATGLQRAWSQLPQLERLQWGVRAKGTTRAVPPPLGSIRRVPADPEPKTKEESLKALIGLMVSTMDADEMRMLVAFAVPALTRALPERTSPDNLAYQVITKAKTRGYLGTLVEAWKEKRPYRSHEIERAARCLVGGRP